MRTPAAFAAGFNRALKWGGEEEKKEKKKRKKKKGESSSEKTDSD